MKRLPDGNRQGDKLIHRLVFRPWGLLRFHLGRRAASHPVLAATIPVVIAFAVITLLVIDSNHHANRAAEQAAANARAVSREQALITKYLEESNPAGRHRIKLECEEVNQRFSNLGKILEHYHPPGAIDPQTVALIKSLETGLHPVDCLRLASIGPTVSELR